VELRRLGTAGLDVSPSQAASPAPGQDGSVLGERHDVRLAVEREIDEISEVLADAFEHYAWTRWTVDERDHRSRIRALQALALTELAMPYGEVWVALDDDTAIVSAAVWMRPDSAVPATVGARIAPLQAALEGGRHAQSVEAEAAVAAHRPPAPHYYLGAVGTLPIHQRMGYASAVLRPVLRRLDIERADAFLDTCGPENVAFYASMGFATAAEVTVPTGGPTVWCMARPPDFTRSA
jgi:GNAT superfamily N-acetyltransferase